MSPFLLLTGSYPESRLTQAIDVVRNGVKAVHDLLQIATQTGAHVAIICRSLSAELREDIWQDVTGCSFATQISRVLASGGTVKILLHNRAEDDAVSLELMDLAELHAGLEPKLQIVVTNETEFWQTFPHFTIVNDPARSAYSLYVEMKPVDAFATSPAYLTSDHRVNGCLFINDEAANGIAPGLMRQFHVLFKKAKRLARQQTELAAE